MTKLILHLQAIKGRAKKKGVPFNLTEEDLIIPTNCPALKIPMIQEWGTTGKGDRENAPSVDRIIPELGYVKGNVRVMSMKANRLKSNATLEDMVNMLEWYTINHELALDTPTFTPDDTTLHAYNNSVTRISTLLSEGKTQRAIVKQLNDEGLTTKRGGCWSLIQVQREIKKLSI